MFWDRRRQKGLGQKTTKGARACGEYNHGGIHLSIVYIIILLVNKKKFVECFEREKWAYTS